MRLKRGDVLVKKRGGATRRSKVLRVGRLSVILEDLAPSNEGRSGVVQTRALTLGADGLPDGYRRAEEAS